MRDSLRARCELFVENRDIMKASFRWENALLFPLCAGIYTGKVKTVNPVEVKKCKEMIRDKTGFLSEFRGIPCIVLAALLAMEENPEERLQKTLEMYEVFKREFHGSPYLPVTAFMAAGVTEASDYARVAAKAKGIYKKIKENHPFLTSGEDVGTAAMLAMSSLSEDTAVLETEKCYQILMEEFGKGNPLQSLSHVLALGEEDVRTKCGKTVELYKILKEKGCRYGKGMELSVLGVLAMLTVDIIQTAEDIREVDELLRSYKGFGDFGIGRAQRLMYAAIIVSGELSSREADSNLNMTAVNSVTNIIIAEQAAVSAVIIASAAAASTND